MEKEIYMRIKEIRKQKGMTLKDLSEKTNLSISFLSQMERGKSAITMVSLKKIADVMGLPMKELFSESDVKEEFVGNSRAHLLLGMQRNYKEFSVLSGRFEGRKLDSFYLKMAPHFLDMEEIAHEGEEIFLVLKGRATAIVDGIEYTANEGETIHFPSTRPHKIVNNEDTELEMFTVIIPSIF
ncbi:putative transcriptional regulator with cupin domain [Desulfosporosinus orientis DSM 765]|uniref:Putative transcriptional regulator with cupin domain n=1 Tax=Desulfosporosinus orientis (strain ATCC 19365 / DSM 765 / NCIMB 8382 / VKM B-1628 / Singapore I) TaxID=768706 RepID=G7WGN0_DESOD|nr:XRE family transcriptional regulator [Desulfosporosinus orientis]AET68466.1 putative transcriptional regulator with cupin domain [Desulfosporosinus orientis DSM 765]